MLTNVQRSKSRVRRTKNRKSTNFSQVLPTSHSKNWALQDPMPQTEILQSDNKVFGHVFSTTITGAFVSSVTLPVSTGNYVTLALFPNYANWTGVFDQYRITRAEFWIVPRSSSNFIPGVNHSLLSSVVDYDDDTPLASVAQSMNYPSNLTTPGSNGHYHIFTPHVAVAAYSGAFTSYGNRTNMWIDCASPSVRHYGMKFVIDPTDVVYTYDFIIRAAIEFRNPRSS